MNLTRVLLVGGFLGAGKTTALARLAKHFSDSGNRVGLITNDQADDLVDTARLKQQGYQVEQVAGACFCCSFNDLIDQAAKLALVSDIVIAEPVGSCTDLAATVTVPILKYHGVAYDLMPYSVLVDPVLADALIVNGGAGGFPSEVAYIFRKQLEEADLICINKIDQITEEKLARLVGEIWKAFPQSAVYPISAVTGKGFGDWLTALSTLPAKVRVADVDYDEYAKGEASLGWLNLSADIESAAPRTPNADVLTLINDLSGRLDGTGARIAHIKIMVSDKTSFAVAQRTAGSPTAILSASSARPLTSAKLLINARVVLDPKVLEQQVLASLAASFGAGTVVSNTKCSSFRPSRPMPIHRLSGI